MEDDRRILYVSAVLGGGAEPEGVEAAIRSLAGRVRRADGEAAALGDRQDEVTVDVTRSGR